MSTPSVGYDTQQRVVIPIHDTPLARTAVPSRTRTTPLRRLQASRRLERSSFRRRKKSSEERRAEKAAVQVGGGAGGRRPRVGRFGL